MNATVPFDTGLQAERTLLAWRRTCLALAFGNAVGLRYLVADLGPAAALAGLVGLALSGAAWFAADRRYRLTHRSLVAQPAALRLGGAAAAGTAAAAALLALLALTFLLFAGRPR